MHSEPGSGTACCWRRGGPGLRAAPARVAPPRYGAGPGCCFGGPPRNPAGRVLAGRDAAAPEQVSARAAPVAAWAAGGRRAYGVPLWC
jgi:hypothetical protein